MTTDDRRAVREAFRLAHARLREANDIYDALYLIVPTERVTTETAALAQREILEARRALAALRVEPGIPDPDRLVM